MLVFRSFLISTIVINIISTHCRETEDGELWYYSTRAQFEEVYSLLDSADLEEELCSALLDVMSEIKRHMSLTESITEENKGNRKSRLEVEDGRDY